MRLVWLWVMLVLASECYGCLEHERIALLQLKASINHQNRNSKYAWEETWNGEATTDCCEWERVKCSTTTGRVMQLSLDSTIYLDTGDWYLNASMFLPFEELESLDLSYNHLAGWLENEELLRLDFNSSNNNTLPSVGLLSSLKTLSLSHNHLNGSIDIGEFCKMNNLKELDLSGNSIEDIKGKLEVLYLGENSFNNSILPYLGILSSLKTLDLWFNHLNGSIDIGELHNMSNLEELDLSDNGGIDNIKGNGEGLKSLSKLKILHLKDNNFHASILRSLDAPLSLKTLDLRSSELKGLVTSIGLDGLKHVQDLYLDYSSIDKSFLYNAGVMSSLRVLTLRGIQFNGSLPNQGWSELSYLQELDLSENGFNGTLPSCFGDLTSIRLLDLSLNQFTGNIALSPLTNLATLEFLDLSYNNFEIPPSFVSFFNHSKLKVLLGDNNRLSDQIESQTWTPRFQLQVFHLSNCGSNKPGMKLPQFLFYQYDLRMVDLSNSILVGMFPVSLLKNNTRLEVLTLTKGHVIGPFLLPSSPRVDLSCNHLTGEIPIEVGKLSNIHALNLSHNKLTGSIPTTFSHLSVAHNNLSGPTPEPKAQSATFEESSYKGNSLLCGLPLKTNCLATVPTSTMPKVLDGELSSLLYYRVDGDRCNFVHKSSLATGLVSPH
ncbi:Receptor-like protein 9a [Camellia lanceoleosa]|uniref:Receptor-like protein 9a n=1 Tax=Camellia lanceoleosa TaxID=1840588 RepID=A0ACC0IBS7_9ERIC|nr:Receptor-like protein 9a [Camellia lanceoleosa]